jgi:hypothetical protein
MSLGWDGFRTLLELELEKPSLNLRPMPSEVLIVRVRSKPDRRIPETNPVARQQPAGRVEGERGRKWLVTTWEQVGKARRFHAEWADLVQLVRVCVVDGPPSRPCGLATKVLQYQTTKPVAQLDLDGLAGGLGVVRDAVEVPGDRDCDMMIDFFARPGVLIDHARDSAAGGLGMSTKKVAVSGQDPPGSLSVR